MLYLAFVTQAGSLIGSLVIWVMGWMTLCSVGDPMPWSGGPSADAPVGRAEHGLALK
jgi:membrane protein YqaA with SNARE-associated domain